MEARIREIDMQIADSLAHQGPEEGAHPIQDEKKEASTLGAFSALASWFSFLGFGGFFLILYYCHIEYFPELEWEKSLTYLAAISLLGIGVAAIYGLALVVPGIIWSEFLIFDQFLRQRFCHIGPDGREPCYQSVVEKLVLPFVVFMAVTHVAAIFLEFWLLAVIAAGGLVALCGYSYSKFSDEIDKIKSESTDEKVKSFLRAGKSTCLYKYTITAGVAALAGLVSFLIIVAIAIPSGKSAGLLFFCTLAVVISNLLVAVQFHRKPLRAITTGVIATLILLISGEILVHGQEALSVRVLDQFGVGNQGKENSATVVFSKVGRELLEANHIKDVKPLDKNSPIAFIENAKILSRLGEEYLIEVGGRRVVIPKTEVLSWSKIRLAE